MWEDIEISVKKITASQLKEKPDQKNLGFGVHFTDHMFLMKWDRQKGWHDAEICPFQNLQLSPAAIVFHYGQAIFEGLKAYRSANGEILLFRAADNFARMNRSATRMCMPRLPVDKVIKALKALIYLDREWVPVSEGATLYIRPAMVAIQPMLEVKPSDSYYFYIIMSPVGAYYPEGFNPTKIYVSEKYVRSLPGGVGEAKTAGNYAASLLAQQDAGKAGYTQVLWLDGCERKYIEEVGTSNIFFRINDTLITPSLGGSILPGVTRDSVITLAKDWGMDIVERKVAIDEVIEASKDGSLQESFATGTAAVISPVGELCYKEETFKINGGEVGQISEKFYKELQKIQFGDKKESHGWSMRVC